ncbi:MAG TPA: hypothetical protein VJO13_03775, partial [Ktedonobacterales bacterium]|nr:hypothetical protein [Ktedonobacterales bacterium]
AGVLTLLCVCAFMVVRTFGGPIFCPTSLPPLQMSRVIPISAPSPCRIDLRSSCPGVIDFLAPAAPGTGGSDNALDSILLSQDGTFYTVEPGQHSPHGLALPDACDGVVALSADRAWLACVAHTEGCIDCLTACTACFGTSVIMVSLLHGSFGQQREIIPSEPDVAFGVLSWSPGARYLAVLRRLPDSTAVSGNGVTCSIAVYADNGPNAAMNMIQQSALADENVDLCETEQLLWSPDGNYIALLQGGHENHPFLVYVIPTEKLAPTLYSENPVPTGVQLIQVKSLLTLPAIDADSYHANPYLGWTPDSHALAVSVAYGFEVALVDPRTGAQTPIFTLPDSASPIGIFSWMPDGKQLLFAIGHGGVGTCGSPPNSIYTYTLPPNP